MRVAARAPGWADSRRAKAQRCRCWTSRRSPGARSTVSRGARATDAARARGLANVASEAACAGLRVWREGLECKGVCLPWRGANGPSWDAFGAGQRTVVRCVAGERSGARRRPRRVRLLRPTWWREPSRCVICCVTGRRAVLEPGVVVQKTRRALCDTDTQQLPTARTLTRAGARPSRLQYTAYPGCGTYAGCGRSTSQERNVNVSQHRLMRR